MTLISHDSYVKNVSLIANLELLWARYQKYANNDFQKRINKSEEGYLAASWEMYLGCRLMDNGFQLRVCKDSDYDLCVLAPEGNIWVECVAPLQGTQRVLINQEECERLGDMCKVDNNIVLQRITNAIANKYDEQITKTKKPDEALVLAVNLREVYGTFDQLMELLFGFEKRFYIDSQKSGMIAENAMRGELKKANGSQIRVGYFTSNLKERVSAVLVSDEAVGSVSSNPCFAIIHNPYALHPIDLNLFECFEQWYMKDESSVQRICTKAN